MFTPVRKSLDAFSRVSLTNTVILHLQYLASVNRQGERSAYSVEEAVEMAVQPSTQQHTLPTAKDWLSFFALLCSTPEKAVAPTSLPLLPSSTVDWIDQCWRTTWTFRQMESLGHPSLPGERKEEWKLLWVLWGVEASFTHLHDIGPEGTLADVDRALYRWLTGRLLPHLSFFTTTAAAGESGDPGEKALTAPELWDTLYATLTLVLPNLFSLWSPSLQIQWTELLKGKITLLNDVSPPLYNALFVTYLVERQRPVSSFTECQSRFGSIFTVDEEAILVEMDRRYQSTRKEGTMTTDQWWFLPVYELFLNLDHLERYRGHHPGTENGKDDSFDDFCTARFIAAPFQMTSTAEDERRYHAKHHIASMNDAIVDKINEEMNQLALNGANVAPS